MYDLAHYPDGKTESQRDHVTDLKVAQKAREKK